MSGHEHEHEHDSHDDKSYNKKCYCDKCKRTYDEWCRDNKAKCKMLLREILPDYDERCRKNEAELEIKSQRNVHL
jgi:hypothetical protein